MKKKQYIHKIALYKINTFEHNVTNKKLLFYKNKFFLHSLYGLQILNEFKSEILPIDIIKYIKNFLYI